MKNIKLSNEETERIIQKIQSYFSEQLSQEIGQFDAQFLLEFFLEEIGPYFYNSGLRDAQAVLKSRLDNISDAIYELEKVTEFRK